MIGKIIKAEISEDSPQDTSDGEKVLKKLRLITDAGRVWQKTQWFTLYDDPEWIPREPFQPARHRIVCGETICPESDKLGPLWRASPDQMNGFVQEEDILHWPSLGVLIAKNGPEWLMLFDVLPTEQEKTEKTAIWIQMEIEATSIALRPFEIATVKTLDDAEKETALRERLADLQKELKGVTPSSATITAGTDSGTDPWEFLPKGDHDREQVIAMLGGAKIAIESRYRDCLYNGKISSEAVAREALDLFSQWPTNQFAVQPTQRTVAEWVRKWIKAGQPDPTRKRA
ncbi:MAG: hypothetical protein H7836_14890 [Magnetococcus sp. YQC-3]